MPSGQATGQNAARTRGPLGARCLFMYLSPIAVLYLPIHPRRSPPLPIIDIEQDFKEEGFPKMHTHAQFASQGPRPAGMRRTHAGVQAGV